MPPALPPPFQLLDSCKITICNVACRLRTFYDKSGKVHPALVVRLFFWTLGDVWSLEMAGSVHHSVRVHPPWFMLVTMAEDASIAPQPFVSINRTIQTVGKELHRGYWPTGLTY